jgi:hypothetical protein
MDGWLTKHLLEMAERHEVRLDRQETRIERLESQRSQRSSLKRVMAAFGAAAAALIANLKAEQIVELARSLLRAGGSP